MVSLKPDDFLSDDGSPALPFLLSLRSQSLLLAAATEIQDRSSWDEMDDTDWNDTEKAVSEAMYEIMEEVESEPTMPDNHLFVNKQSNVALAANTPTKVTFPDLVIDEGGLWDASDNHYELAAFADSGLYHITAQLLISSVTGDAYKIAQIRLNETYSIALQSGEADANYLNVSVIVPVGAGETVSIWAVCSHAATVHGSTTDDVSWLRLLRVRP